MTNPLAYVPAPVPGDCVFKISPSQFPAFISYPHNWFRTEVLGEEGFNYNTSTVIGTIVHYCAKMVALGEIVDKVAIEEYIDSLEEKDDYDRQTVRDHFGPMAETLVNDYVLENDFFVVEEAYSAYLVDGFYAAGTIDRIEGTTSDATVVDFKTYHSKTKPRAITQAHRYQLLVYAYILKQHNINPTRMRLVYVNRHIEGEISEKTNKRMKSYPPEVTVLTESISQEDLDFIEGLLELAVDTVQTYQKYPELAHVIWHDPRLRPE